ncbi:MULTISPECIES: D-alanyl-D-alanine carboxypeptidase family protein [Thalassobaculum]|uniref:serine-type D-Ala-D-Ala carboxypeptidase n=1 Tax=Thalassobaculum litoreum DSM 18839 TaxID=1123362 RepID=A0A8G2EU27_9PROT|nr:MULTISPECIES: D-alanyl-D-alanine carboxypeptidase family protein [Thalassobaculum]SDF12434.1 D-alanyl-D-alanine carboxypeptidase (penicillin-binding protein 5/6) [Thalassobaculum litoreum DSM 18839]
MRVSILTRLATLALFLVLAVPPAAEAARIETNAREAILLDYDTGQVLYQKNADDPMPPASMTKIMTVFLAFERLADGRLKMDDEIPISEKAWRKGGSKMFVEIGSRVSVHDILHGIIVQSGNDAAIALAEAIAGTEEAFAELMTEEAAAIGIENATFRNATGWPDPEHRMTARGLAILAAETIRRFPEHYKIYAEETFTYNEIKQGNRNPLLYKGMGADGLKTGHTENAGYGLTASAKRGDRRLVMVVNGLDSVSQRASESERLIEWGFREFDNYKLLERGEAIDQAAVWLGDQPTVPLVTEDELFLTLPRAARKEMRVTVEYEGPIPAPIVKGQVLARMRIAAPDMEDRVVPLLAGEDVGKLGPLGRITSAVGHLIWGPSTGD